MKHFFFRAIRTLYYRLAKKLADVDLIEHFNGFGLYDRQVIEQMRQIPDVYPYLRGLLVELGYETVKVPYNQQKRRDGSSNNNFYTLFDMAMLGITSHSRVPLRLATLSGFLLSGISMVIASVYLILKAVYWDTFSFGLAPVIIGVFFFGAVQLFFIGVLGEYIQIIHTQIMCRPPVVEKERINLPVRLI